MSIQFVEIKSKFFKISKLEEKHLFKKRIS